jgi:hypothetical protein
MFGETLHTMMQCQRYKQNYSSSTNYIIKASFTNYILRILLTEKDNNMGIFFQDSL